MVPTITPLYEHLRCKVLSTVIFVEWNSTRSTEPSVISGSIPTVYNLSDHGNRMRETELLAPVRSFGLHNLDAEQAIQILAPNIAGRVAAKKYGARLRSVTPELALQA